MTPSAHTHLWISGIRKGLVPETRAESDYLVLDCLATNLNLMGQKHHTSEITSGLGY